MSSLVLLIAVVFFGVFSQTVSGFGLGLIAMPIVSTALGLDVARPLLALVGVSMQLCMMVYNRHALSLRTIGVMSLIGFAGIPAGVWLAERPWLSEEILLTGLAFLTISYALYALFVMGREEGRFKLPARLFGNVGPFAFVSGVLSGAYNVGGPPIMIYADGRRWSADEVRSNLQGFFMFKAVVLIVTHTFSGNYTRDVLTAFAWTTPAIVGGLLVGFATYRFIDAVRFRQIVLVLLVAVGLNILYGLYIAPALR